jgi:hypothetical protein
MPTVRHMIVISASVFSSTMGYMGMYSRAKCRAHNEVHLDSPSRARLPTCTQIMLLSSWPRSTLSKADFAIDRPSLRKEFGQVAEAEWLHLYRTAIRVGVDANSAEDLVQGVLLQAFCALEKMNRIQLDRLQVHRWLTNLAERAARSDIRLGTLRGVHSS